MGDNDWGAFLMPLGGTASEFFKSITEGIKCFALQASV